MTHPARTCSICGCATTARHDTRHPVCSSCRATTPHALLVRMTAPRPPYTPATRRTPR